jgi:hypothetical protein
MSEMSTLHQYLLGFFIFGGLWIVGKVLEGVGRRWGDNPWR